MPIGRRRLFLYWRVADGDLQAALHALRQWQAQLRAERPGLLAEAFLRHEPAAAEATVMESYGLTAAAAASNGIDAAVQQNIVQEGNQLLAGWLRGQRHVELFDALEP